MKTPREVLLNQHRHVEPKLDKIWRATLRRGRSITDATERVPPMKLLWRELIWPCRRIWAGLACSWALIIALNVASYEPAQQVARKTEPPSREEMRALSEQRRLLAQLIEPMSETVEKHQSKPPGPRSDRCSQFLNA